MQTTRFPPAGTPAWYAEFERQLLVERVDNDRQWRLMRQISGLLTGLDPIIDIVTTSTTTAGECVECPETSLCFTAEITDELCDPNPMTISAVMDLEGGCFYNGSGEHVTAATIQFLTDHWRLDVTGGCGAGGSAIYETAGADDCTTGIVLSFVSSTGAGFTWPSTITVTTCV